MQVDWFQSEPGVQKPKLVDTLIHGGVKQDSYWGQQTMAMI